MNKHLFLDCYSLSTELLSNVENMQTLLNEINKLLFQDKGKITLIPYFKGKIKQDGGVSGIILGNNSHFTCHTFCYKNTMFVDYFGTIDNHEHTKKLVLKYFPTKDIDLCEQNTKDEGNFGKHIIVRNSNLITFKEGKELIERILTDINMTPINNVIENYVDTNHFDLLQPIAESHISIHRNGEEMMIDIFSCKWFDEEKLQRLLNVKEYTKVRRGIKYKQ